MTGSDAASSATIFGVARTVLTREPALGRGMTKQPTRARLPLISSAAVTVEMRDVAPGLWLWRQPHPAWEEGDGLGAGGGLVRGRVARHARCCSIRSPRRRARARCGSGSTRSVRRRSWCSSPITCATWTCSCAGTAPRALRSAAVLARRRAATPSCEPVQPGDELPGGLLAPARRPRRDGDAAVPAGAARAGVRRRHDGAGRRAARLGDAVARGADAAGAARAAGASVRARARLARRAGARARATSRPRSSASRGRSGSAPRPRPGCGTAPRARPARSRADRRTATHARSGASSRLPRAGRARPG